MTIKIREIPLPTSEVKNTTDSYNVELDAGVDLTLPDESIEILDANDNVLSTDSNPLYEDKTIEVPIYPVPEKLDFIFTVDTTIIDSSPSDSYTLNFTSSNLLNALIKWGDGTQEYVSPSQSSPIIHQYLTSGVYDISISGILAFKPTSDRLKLTKVKQWGKLSFNSLNNCFSNCFNLTSVPQNETLVLPIDCRVMFGNTSISNFGKFQSDSAFSLSGSFSGTNFDYNIGDWNVAAANSMVNMFFGTSMSQANCDAIFTGWTRWNSTTGTAGITLKSNVSLHMGATDYTRGGDAEDAFNYLVNTLNWTITFS